MLVVARAVSRLGGICRLVEGYEAVGVGEGADLVLYAVIFEVQPAQSAIDPVEDLDPSEAVAVVFGV